MLTQENLRETLKNFEDQVAIEESGQSVTYAELLRQADQVSSYLLKRGCRPQSRIGICTQGITDWVVCMLGVIRARCVLVPLDASLPKRRVSHIVREANIEVILASTTCLSPDTVNAVPTATLADLSEATKDEPTRYPDYQENDDLYIYFTSGSTGVPKGIVGKNSSLWHFIRWETNAFNIPPGYRFSQFISPYFDAFLRDIFVPLLSGGTICVPPREDDFFTFDKVRQWINDQRINLIHCVPSVFRVFNDDGLSAADFVDLQYVLLSGEKIVPAELNRWYETFGDQIQLVNLYGATETTMIRSCYRIQPEDVAKAKISIGQPIADTKLVVLDKHDKPCRPLIAGDLYVISRYLSKGYLNQPELTAEKFVNLNPEDSTVRTAFKTGDRARLLPDGSVELLGREDRMVKVRGIRIELDEIENVLANAEWVKQAVVNYDEKAERLAAFVIAVPSNSPASLSEQIEEYLKDHLPAYMIPSGITIVDEFPLLSNGKIDYKTLLQKHRTEAIVLPVNEVEEKVLTIWKEILKTDQISTDKRFHRMGGNSLNIMRLIPRIFTEFGVRTTLAELFTNLTIQKQAELISNRLQVDDAAAPSDVQADESIALSRIEGALPHAYYPLSSAQRRLYFLSEFENASTAYNIPQVVKLEGRLNISTLELALEKLMARHEGLRTAIEIVEEEAVQKIYDQVPFSVVHHEAANEESACCIIREFIRPFDVSRAPLFRVGLIKLADQVHLLVVDMHHIITDGVSHGVLIRDFMNLYHGKGLSPLRLQYKDYAVWQQDTRQQRSWARQQAFWKKEFEEGGTALELPTDFPRPAIKSYRGSSKQFSLSKSESQAIKALADQTDATLFMVLLSCYYLFLRKVSGQSDITVGTTTAGRYQPDLEDIIGMFVNTIPLRNYPRGNLSFREFLANVKAKTLDCFAHQTYPYEELIGEVHASRHTSRSPLFDVMFNVANYEQEELTLPDLTITAYDSEHPISKFDLTLTASEYENRLHFDFEYCTDLFTSDTIDRFIDYWRRIVVEVTNNPEKKLGQIEVLSPQERYTLLHTFNDTRVDYLDETLLDQFAQRVADHPTKPAVTYTSHELSYQQLDEKSTHLATHLRSLGVGSNERVGILLEPSELVLVSVLAVLKAGAAFVPIDQNHPVARKKYMVENSALYALLSSASLIENNRDVVASIAPENLIDVASLSFQASNLPVDVSPPAPADLAYVLYTSGSTGQPKGVMITHRALFNYLSWSSETYLREEDCPMALFSSLSFDLTLTSIFLPLISGNTLHVYPHAAPTSLIERVIADGRAKVIKLTPSHLRIVKESDVDVSAIQRMIVGGEQLDADLAAAMQDRGKASLEIYNEYGPTEATIGCMLHKFDRSDGEEGKSVSIGKAAPNNKIYILDDQLQVVPLGTVGEMYIGGAQLTQGYMASEKQTKDRLIANPYKSGELLYKTGDLARWLPNGTARFLGRADDQVKIRGFRIELGEIESHLAIHPAVKGTHVATKGQGEKKDLVAYYAAEKVLPSHELEQFLADQLPAYMVPQRYVWLEQMPLTSNGKIDRRALPEPTTEAVKECVAPTNEVEAKLIEIWSEILKVDKEQIGINRNFFDLGGNSLHLIYMASRLKRDFSATFSIVDIFNNPTVSSLARMLNGFLPDTVALVDSRAQEEADIRDETLELLAMQ